MLRFRVDIDESAGLYGSRKFEQDLLRELEAAFDRLDQILDMRPEQKLVVYVWDPALFDREYRGLFRFPAAGLCPHHSTTAAAFGPVFCCQSVVTLKPWAQSHGGALKRPSKASARGRSS